MDADITQSDSFWKLWAWFERNKKQVIYGVLGAAVLTLLIWFIVWRQHEKQVDASAALSEVSASLLMNPQANPAAAESLLGVASRYPGSAAAERAILLAAANLFTQGKYVEAQNNFGRFTREFSTSPFLGQAKLGIAASLEAQGKPTEAIAAYKDLIERHPNEPAIPQAKLALARLYEAQNQADQARKLYEELMMTGQFTAYGAEANSRLEELKAKFPNLTTAPAPGTNPVPVRIETK
jgi:tetratricopeptide (TPR) repeat protein